VCGGGRDILVCCQIQVHWLGAVPLPIPLPFPSALPSAGKGKGKGKGKGNGTQPTEWASTGHEHIPIAPDSLAR